MRPTTKRHWRHRTLAVIAVVAVAALASLVAGGGVATAQKSKKAAVELKFAAQATATVGAFKALAANYMAAHSDVSITVVGYPTQDYGATLQAQFRGGQGPDLMYGAPGTGNPHGLINFAKAGYLADLSSLPFVKRLPANAKPYLGIGKKTYAFPLDVSTFGGVYNMQVFNQLGLKFPKNWNDVLKMCDTAKAKGKVMFAISGLVSGTQILTVIAPFVYGANPNWNTQRLAGKTTFAASSGWKKGLQAWIDMNKRGCFQPGASGYSLGASQALVARGDAVAWLGVSNVIGAIQPLNTSVSIGVFPIPGPTAKTSVYIHGYGNAVGVNKNSPNLKTAIDFVKFMGREGQSRIYPNLIGNMSILQSSTAAKTGKILLKNHKPWGRYAGWGALIKDGKTIQIPNLPWPNGQVYADLTSGAAGLLAGSTTIDDVLSRLDKDWNLQ